MHNIARSVSRVFWWPATNELTMPGRGGFALPGGHPVPQRTQSTRPSQVCPEIFSSVARARLDLFLHQQGLDTTTPAGRRDMTQNSLLVHMDQVASLQFSRTITVINPQPIDEAIVVPLDRHNDAPYRHEVAGPDNGRCTYQRRGSADDTIATSDDRWLRTLTECHSVSILAGSRATQRRPEASLRLHSATWPTSSRCKD